MVWADYSVRSRPARTLRPHAGAHRGLVHEAYLRMMGQRYRNYRNRAHLPGVAAHLMRQILIDYARSRNAENGAAEGPASGSTKLAFRWSVRPG
jgi:hypothetical protein